MEGQLSRRGFVLGAVTLALVGCGPIPTDKPDEHVETLFGTLFLSYNAYDKTSGSFRLEIPKRNLVSYHLTSNVILINDPDSSIVHELSEDLALALLVGRANDTLFSFSPYLFNPQKAESNFYSKWYCPVENLDHTVSHTFWSRWADKRFTQGGFDTNKVL